jgi:hypothetical protein
MQEREWGRKSRKRKDERKRHSKRPFVEKPSNQSEECYTRESREKNDDLSVKEKERREKKIEKALKRAGGETRSGYTTMHRKIKDALERLPATSEKKEGRFATPLDSSAPSHHVFI